MIAVERVLRAESELWRNVAQWYRCENLPDNGERFWVLNRSDVQRLESVLIRFYGSLPSDYESHTERFARYRAIMHG